MSASGRWSEGCQANEILRLARCIFSAGGARRPQEKVRSFIDQHRERFGGEAICKLLQVALSAHSRHSARQRESALEQALYARQTEQDASLIHHADRGSQYVSSATPSRGRDRAFCRQQGGLYDNALAETINGLYKAELIHRRAPWKTVKSLELAPLEWEAWFKHQRLLEPIGYIPPAEAENRYYLQSTPSLNTTALKQRSLYEI